MNGLVDGTWISSWNALTFSRWPCLACSIPHPALKKTKISVFISNRRASSIRSVFWDVSTTRPWTSCWRPNIFDLVLSMGSSDKARHRPTMDLRKPVEGWSDQLAFNKSGKLPITLKVELNYSHFFVYFFSKSKIYFIKCFLRISYVMSGNLLINKCAKISSLCNRLKIPFNHSQDMHKFP